MKDSSPGRTFEMVVALPRSGARKTHRSRRFVVPALLAVIVAVLLAQQGGQAAATDALPFSKSYLGTINYVTSSVNLTEQDHPIDPEGFSTGTLPISGIPADADIVAAYLYWETITETAFPDMADGAKFRGTNIILNDAMAVKRSSTPLVGSLASCWSSGTPITMTLFRADVLPMLPTRVDQDGRPTPKRIVNSADLASHGLPNHTVTLPARQGNQLPESAGATLVIVYNFTGNGVLPSEPLRKIVFYDGIFVQPNLTTPMTQTLQGFYKSSATPSAKLTHILASGQPNNNERIFFNGTNNAARIGGNDPVTGGSSSQRGWSGLTIDVSSKMNPLNNNPTGLGETATTTVDHAQGGGFDCLTWGAVILSTAVADTDGDGLPDGLEGPNAILDPKPGSKTATVPLPNLNAMGASVGPKDLFVEVNALWAPAGTSYGSATAPYSETLVTKTDLLGHHHFPTPEDFKRIGDRYALHGITVHFDIGDIDDYHDLGTVAHSGWTDDYTSTAADGYFVPSGLARGGEIVEERACDPDSPTCHFPDFPGTVGWKFGLQIIRDAPVGDLGEELDPDNFVWGATQRRRFDRERFGLFHYLLYAHARGTPRSHPCLTPWGQPAPYTAQNNTACETTGNPPVPLNNPDFNSLFYHVPTSSSGVADLPGGNLMVTLGFWDEHVGKPFARAATTFHELGHNLDLWHGGLPGIWGDKTTVITPEQPQLVSTSTYIEPNCKPNYQSSMSYLFQVNGLFDSNDNIQLDYSGTAVGDLNETVTLTDGGVTSPYRWSWFAPAGSLLAGELGAPAATRFCSGVRFPPNTNPNMARVYTTTTNTTVDAGKIDWNGNKVISSSDPQDVNLDGTLSSLIPARILKGHNDWSSIRLDQISAGRRSVKFQAPLEESQCGAGGVCFGDYVDIGSGDYVDIGSGDYVDIGSGDYVDIGSGDYVDIGSGLLLNTLSGDYVDIGSGDYVDIGSGDYVDIGSGDYVDLGSGDYVDIGSGSEKDEVSYDDAKNGAPYTLKVCAIGVDQNCNLQPPVGPNNASYHRMLLTWFPPTAGTVIGNEVERKGGTGPTKVYTIGAVTQFVDPEELPQGVTFTYRVRAQFAEPPPFSGWSIPASRAGVNNQPAAGGDSYVTNQNTPLPIATADLLANDTDGDSPTAYIARRLVQITVQPTHGTLVATATGFTYTPESGFRGQDSFTYTSDDGLWAATSTPLSAATSVTVSIRVKRQNEP